MWADASVPDARDERVAEDRARGEDVVGEAAGVGVLLADALPGLVEQEPVEDVGGLYPGRLLAPGEFVPPAVVDFIGRQLHLDGEELGDYAARSETRHEHLAELRRLYGFRSFYGRRRA